MATAPVTPSITSEKQLANLEASIFVLPEQI